MKSLKKSCSVGLTSMLVLSASSEITGLHAEDAGKSTSDPSVLAVEIAPGSVQTGKDFTKMDLSKKTLKGVIFDHAVLKGSNLSNADLTQAFLKDANLNGADLSGANLVTAYLLGADFTGAKLENADFTNAVYDFQTKWPEGFEPSSKGLILLMDGKDLSGNDLSGKNFTGGIFSNSKLKKANLNKSVLVRCVFTNTDLSEADLTAADLTTAYFQGANLKGANLAGADLSTAVYDSKTQWPEGFDPSEHGAMLLQPVVAAVTPEADPAAEASAP